MTLAFSVKFKDGADTHFVEKIWSGVGKGEFLMKTSLYKPDFTKEYAPKIHTVREDKADRWRVGMTINCVLFNRTKNRYEFATLICTSIQEISIEWHSTLNCLPVTVHIDDRELSDVELMKFIENDGFDNYEQFEKFFSSDFDGKIIHWTDKRY